MCAEFGIRSLRFVSAASEDDCPQNSLEGLRLQLPDTGGPETYSIR